MIMGKQTRPYSVFNFIVRRFVACLRFVGNNRWADKLNEQTTLIDWWYLVLVTLRVFSNNSSLFAIDRAGRYPVRPIDPSLFQTCSQWDCDTFLRLSACLGFAKIKMGSWSWCLFLPTQTRSSILYRKAKSLECRTIWTLNANF